jgi:hypothetical protein
MVTKGATGAVTSILKTLMACARSSEFGRKPEAKPFNRRERQEKPEERGENRVVC